MGGKVNTVKKHAEDLRDYTNTVVAVHLLKEVIDGGATVTVGQANDIVAKVNQNKKPQIGDVVKEILAAAGKAGEDKSQWKYKDGAWHLEAAITIGGAVYTVDFVQEGLDEKTGQNYTVNITSKLSDDNPIARGKLFFDPSNKASVKLTYKDGELTAVTKKGLQVKATSWVPYPFQNETLAKFSESLTDQDPTKQQRLAILGTGSGKSIVMAGIAQAVGKTVMIVPDETLVAQQSKEVGDMHSAATVHGEKVKRPVVFTLETLKDSVDIDWDDEQILDENEEVDWTKIPKVYPQAFEEFRDNFTAVLEGTCEKQFDQIVLQAEHPLFKVIAPRIKDAMVLIDESHRHTFTEEDAQLLATLKEENSILALTATPTSRLYDIFPGTPLDDLSLGGAIALGTIRPIKPEVSYAKAGDLITQAATNYFNDYYLTPGMNGYIDPKELKKKILLQQVDLDQGEAEKQAMEQALTLNRIRAQRNMAFSDDQATRIKLATIYQKISEGDVGTIDTYKDEVAKIRRETEIDARLKMALSFNDKLDETETRKKIETEVKLTPVDLVKDIRSEQNKDIQRTINSFAIALVFGDKQATIAEKDRTHKLAAHLEDYHTAIVKYDPDGENLDFGNPSVLAKLTECKDLDRKTLLKKFKKANTESAVMKLPEGQRDIILAAILDKAESMVNTINKKKEGTIAEVISTDAAINLDDLGAVKNYAGAVDKSTSAQDVKTQLAQLEVGIRTHIVSDEVIATGVSIKDVLNVQIINTYSPVIESDDNVINGTLSGPQAAGRCVRHNDVSARAQQYIDERYKDKGLILTLDEMIDANDSATKTRAVIQKREAQAKIEAQAKEKFATALAAISEKANTFQLKANELYDEDKDIQSDEYYKYQKAADAAEQLHTSLEDASEKYYEDWDVKTFQDTANDAIATARESELKNHRGWKEILFNVGLAVLALVAIAVAAATLGVGGAVAVGVGIGIAVGVNYAKNRQLFFPINTGSLDKVDALEEGAEAIAELAMN